MSEIALLPAKIDAIAVFTGEKLDVILEQITKAAKDFEADPTTEKGRKEIASMAYKVARSKTVLDDLGKDLVTDWKSKAKLVDEARKKSRDYLDALKDEVREPLTQWEIAEESRLKAEAVAAEIDKAWDEAHMENALIDKAKDLAAREAELLRKEGEAKAKAEAEAAQIARVAQEAADEKARVEREDNIRKEAEAKAKTEAAEAVAKAERDKVAAEERAKLQAELAEKAAKEAADNAAQALKEAEAKAAREAAEAVAKEQARVAAAKAAQDAKDAEEKAQADKLAANRAHQSSINKEALAGFVDNGFTVEQGKAIITLIAGGKIKHVSIKY
jgi:hypothetical protein